LKVERALAPKGSDALSFSSLNVPEMAHNSTISGEEKTGDYQGNS
jgi:hypothetical protein